MAITITSLYKQLFGKKSPTDGTVIDMAEHGRTGGTSAGEGYKRVAQPNKFMTQEGHTYLNSNSTTLGNGATLDLLITTPSDKDIHFSQEIKTTGEVLYELYEGTAVSANGSELTSINRNRLSSNTTGVTIYSGPTVTDDGTQLKQVNVGSNAKNGGTFETKQIILKKSENYIIRFTSSAADNKISWVLDWHEE